MSLITDPRQAPVRCTAMVDPIRLGSRLGWRVTVRGQPPHAATRVYEIAADTDTLAAQEGMRRFEREFEGQCLWRLD